MKKFIIVFVLMFFAVPAFAQDLNHWYGSARIEFPGGLNYHFGAEFVGDINGTATIKLTNEFDSSEFRGWNLRPVVCEIGILLFAPYWDGANFKARYGIRITSDKYIIMIVPNDFAIQQALPKTVRNTIASTLAGYPRQCTFGYAIFGGQIPCEADASIQIQ